MDHTKYMDLRTAADYLSTNPATLMKWVRRGAPCYKPGLRLLFLADELDAWMRSQRRGKRGVQLTLQRMVS